MTSNRFIKLALLLLLGLMVLGGVSGCAAAAPQPPPAEATEAAPQQLEEGSKIAIEGPWSRESPGLMALSGIAYMTIHNEGNEPDRLIAGKTDAAEVVELHKHTMDENGVLRMRMVEGGFIEIPAGGTVALKPGGLHLMLINLTQPLKKGDTYPLTLKFEKFGDVTIDVPITDEPMETAVMVEMTIEPPQTAEVTEAEPTVASTPTAKPPTPTPAPATEAAVTEGETKATAGPVPTPRAPEDLKGGLFVNLTTDNIDRAAMAIGFATKVRKNTGKPVTIFMNTQGVRLADINIPQNTHKSGKTIHQMLQMFMDEGGVALVCPVCMKNVGGLSESEVLPGVIIGTPEYTWSAMFAEDVTVISY